MSDDWQIDADLLERWRGGDLDAGEQLFARHGDAAIRFFRNKVDDEVQDLIQDTFLRLVEGRERIEEGRSFRAYLLGIARRVLLEHLRERSGVRELDASVDSVVAVITGPSTIAARRLEERLLLEGLRTIPIEDQIVLELYYWEKLKAPELATVMGVPPSTMRSRIQRARDRLRKVIDALSEAPELLASTVGDLDGWAERIRGQLD